MSDHLPNLDPTLFEGLPASASSEHKPRILLLYGSTRERSFSRLLEIGRASCRERVSPDV